MASFTRQEALDYHRRGRPGKIQIAPTKPLDSQLHLSLAYSPGVAEAVLEIDEDPLNVFTMTARANLVAVLSNGSAILGLGDLGPLASKPVMEGKGVLFKKFADVDVFDIEINSRDAEEIIEVCKALAPTFGGINLEDIKAPECFEIEERLKAELDIPVFHDDQHGTAIISGAALLNALEVTGKSIESIKVVINGAGGQRHRHWQILQIAGSRRRKPAHARFPRRHPSSARRRHEHLQIRICHSHHRPQPARCFARGGCAGRLVDCRLGHPGDDHGHGA